MSLCKCPKILECFLQQIYKNSKTIKHVNEKKYLIIIIIYEILSKIKIKPGPNAHLDISVETNDSIVIHSFI